jgi:hypothetical protein
MLNFGERDHHNISPNFGIPCMEKFKRSLARKIAFPMPTEESLVVGEAGRVGGSGPA